MVEAWERGRKNRIGKYCGSWKGGISKYKSEFYKNRKKVLERDNYKCQQCGTDGKQYKYGLCVHHIDFNKKNDLLENLITLCTSCHTKLHQDKINLLEIK